MERLVLLFHHLSVAESVDQDVTRAETDPIHISSAMRTKLRTCLKQLEAIASARTQNSPYALALVNVRAVAYPDKYVTSRGSQCIDELVGGGSHYIWWACEEKRRGPHCTEPVTPCDEGTRDELRTCARVSRTVLSPLT